MRLFFCFIILPIFLGCKSNPYDGLGQLKDPKKDTPDTKPVAVFNLKGTIHTRATEGSELIQKFDVTDSENPKGPFRIYFSHLPTGTELKTISETQFEIHFLPNSSFVRGQDSRIVEGQIHVINPENKSLDQDVKWTISNLAVEPNVLGPKEVLAQVQTNLNFTIIAIDTNGEEFPHFSIQNSNGLTGITGVEHFIEDESKKFLPATEYQVNWSSIPAELAGQTRMLVIRACNETYKKCKSIDVQIKIQGQ